MQNLPNNWGDVELAQLFAQYGTVLECRMLHNGDMTRGAGALVRMSTIQQAAAAIDSLNNVSNGVGLPLLVRQVAKVFCLLPLAVLLLVSMKIVLPFLSTVVLLVLLLMFLP